MRKNKAKKHLIKPDPIYGDTMITKFVNNMMIKGKKSLSYSIFYSVIHSIKNKLKEDGILVWRKAMHNVTPSIEVKSRRIGGANFHVPTEVRPDRKISLAMKWIINSARKRNEKTIRLKLLGEIIDAYNMTGNAFKKKENTHKMAESNKAFAHFKF
ncbi:MAG: 30S ribosomal protein S7 [Bacteroides sp.]|nr:MAG: 30S ribosomal protein S7 [Bacteroides sp.]